MFRLVITFEPRDQFWEDPFSFLLLEQQQKSVKALDQHCPTEI